MQQQKKKEMTLKERCLLFKKNSIEWLQETYRSLQTFPTKMRKLFSATIKTLQELVKKLASLEVYLHKPKQLITKLRSLLTRHK